MNHKFYPTSDINKKHIKHAILEGFIVGFSECQICEYEWIAKLSQIVTPQSSNARGADSRTAISKPLTPNQKPP